MRSPSTPGLGSSVTSKRSIGHAFKALASRPPVPGLPDQLASARNEPGAAGCAVQDSETRPPVIPEIAHSTCGQIAAGAECTKTTPRVTTIHLRSRSNVLPQRGVRAVRLMCGCCLTVKLFEIAVLEDVYWGHCALWDALGASVYHKIGQPAVRITLPRRPDRVCHRCPRDRSNVVKSAQPCLPARLDLATPPGCPDGRAQPPAGIAPGGHGPRQEHPGGRLLRLAPGPSPARIRRDRAPVARTSPTLCRHINGRGDPPDRCDDARLLWRPRQPLWRPRQPTDRPGRPTTVATGELRMPLRG